MAIPSEASIGAIDAEITRLEAVLANVRQSIKDMEEDNVQATSFTDREINHMPLSMLKESEQEYLIKIGDLRMKKKGLSLIFGQTIRTVQDIF